MGVPCSTPCLAEDRAIGRPPPRGDNIGGMKGFTRREGLGLYVHLPFCERVCPYCDFAVEAAGSVSQAVQAEYVALLLRELDLVCEEVPERVVGRPLETVYLGGGTPSLFEPSAIERLLVEIGKRLPGEPREVTLELNPGTGECARVGAFRAAGVTRLSVGVQSFDDLTLKRLGRAHKGDEALRGLEACLDPPFRSVSVDLIYGAPGQTEDSARRDLERVLELGIPHVSAYALTVEPGTPFAVARDRGLLQVPDEEVVCRLEHHMLAQLSAAGYVRYEISSFARPGHRSQHNARYWQRLDVLGIGVSAATLLGDLRTRNLRARSTWAQAVRAGKLPWEEIERLTARDARREALFVGLRMPEGVGRAEFARRYGGRPEDELGVELAELRSLGLIEDAAGAIRPTARGMRFSDEVLERFTGVDPPGGHG